MNQELREALEERDWWRRVGTLVGSTLHGWTGYSAASFLDPHMELTGDVARVLLDQQETIESIQADAARWNYVRGCLAQMHSPKMSGQASWRFRPLYRHTGNTVDAAIDKGILEAAKATQKKSR